MNIRRWLSIALVLTIAGSLLAACSSSSTDNNGKQELTINYRTDPPALDVSIAESSATFTVLGAISEGLYRMDADNKPQAALAADLPEISEDGLTYTIKLRDGITWADGTPITANDFVYSFRRTLDPATKATYGFMVAWIKGGNEVLAADGAEAVQAAQEKLGAVALDEQTLQITLEKPVTFFTETLSFLNFYPQKEQFVSQYGDKSGTDANKVLGAGPFVLQTWDHDQKLVLVKNDKYWDKDNVKLEKVTLNIVKDNATGLNLYDSGASDYQVLDGEQYKQLKDSKELVQKSELTSGYLNFQQTNVPAFKNEKIRQAFTAAINREALVETVLQGSTAASGFVPVANLDGNGNEFRKVAGDVAIPYDAKKAKQLLAEGMQEAGITTMPKLEIMGDDNGVGPAVLEFLTGQWEQNLGVKVTITTLPHASRIDRELNKDYDIVSSLWGADYNDPMTWLDLFVTGSALNTQDWSSATYDELITSAQTDSDPVTRAESLVAAEKVLLEEAAVAPLYSRTLNILVKDKVQGLVLPAYGVEFEMKWASIK